MLIQWSPDDEVYLVTLPEFGNALTHGETYEKAVQQGKELLESCVMWWRQDGKPLPEPIVFDFDNQLDVSAAPRRLVESA